MQLHAAIAQRRAHWLGGRPLEAYVLMLIVGLGVTACSSAVTPTTPSAASLATTATISGSTRTQAAAGQIVICHVDGRGVYRALTIGVAAEPAHRTHGDGAPGEQVPGDPTSMFTAECALVPVPVATLVQVTEGTVGTFNFAGQSVMVPAGGPFNNLRFNWFAFGEAPVAFGTLYILSEEYLGLPGDLSPSTPGYVARSETIVNNEYQFAPGVSLAGGTRYWFYTDTQGSFVTSFFGSTYAGGDLYVTGVATFPFHKAMAAPGVFLDANFRLQAASVTP